MSECTECGTECETNRMGWCAECEGYARENPAYRGVPTVGLPDPA